MRNKIHVIGLVLLLYAFCFVLLLLKVFKLKVCHFPCVDILKKVIFPKRKALPILGSVHLYSTHRNNSFRNLDIFSEN